MKFRRRDRWIPGGDEGVRATVRQMADMARDAGTDPAVRAFLWGWLGAAPAPCRVRAALDGTTTWLDDPPGLELVHDPRQMLRAIASGEIAAGDCDDVATLAAAIGIAYRYRVRFVVVAVAPLRAFGHVWTELRAPGGSWVELDTTRPAQYGGAVPPVTRTWTVDVWPTK